VKPGHTVETILEVAKSEDVDLIVMGNRGRGSLKETILGSVSHGVVTHASVPVLIVRGR
jgi:nucleotide-binding universal stress UspA family protein